MRLLFALLLSLTLCSCNKKTVQLPETTNKEITEILDVSTIYMFYDATTGDIEFNRKNMIGSTNWLVAIDKRISLKQALPHLQYLYEKRHADGMHKNDAAKSYLSCSNPDIKNLAFIEHTDIVYSDKDPADFLSNFFSDKTDTDAQKHHYINVASLSAITIGNQMHVETITDKNLVNYLHKLTQNKSVKHNIYMTFKNSLNFQEYITVKTLLLEASAENLSVSNEEIIYN